MDSSQADPGYLDRLRRLYRFASERRYVVGRSELAEEGFNRTSIESWIRTGRLVRLFRGVYAYGRDIETREACWRASLLAAGPGSALTGRSACELWNLVKPIGLLPSEVTVASAQGKPRRLKGQSPSTRSCEVRISRCHLASGHVRQLNELTVVRVAVALIEFASVAGGREIRFAFLEACRLSLINESEISLCFRLSCGRRGTRKLRPLLGLWVPELNRIRSVLEGMFLLEWVKRKLPMPNVNVKVLGFEVDFYWPEYDLILETDGTAFHSDPVQKSIDQAKQLSLEAGGMTVLRATFKQFDRDPEAVLRMVTSEMNVNI